MIRTFTCFICKETHEAAWGEEERDAEAEEVFGGSIYKDGPMVQVCDRCYTTVMGSRN